MLDVYEINEIVKKMLVNVIIPEEFGANLDEEYCPQEDGIESTLRKNLGLSYSQVYTAKGVSQLVIICEDYDFVVKIPFNGQWIYEYERNEDDEEYSEEYFDHFYNADDTDNGEGNCWDYSLNSLIKYRNSIAFGFDNFFAEICKCGEYCGRAIYAQEKVDIYSQSCSSHTPSEHSKTVIENNLRIKNNMLANSFWTRCAIDYYGEEKVAEFFEYLSDNNMGCDLHHGNIGWSAIDGRPVILDWADWRD